MRVLIVEDEPRLAENLAHSLRESAGYAVDIAPDGEEGLFLAEANVYDAVLLDLMLPKRSGLEVLTRLRKAGQRTPVLVLTARDDKESIVALLNAGADDYLTKPFDLGELLARVKALVRRGKGQTTPRPQPGRFATEHGQPHRAARPEGDPAYRHGISRAGVFVVSGASRGFEDRVARTPLRLQLGKIQQRN